MLFGVLKVVVAGSACLDAARVLVRGLFGVVKMMWWLLSVLVW